MAEPTSDATTTSLVGLFASAPGGVAAPQPCPATAGVPLPRGTCQDASVITAKLPDGRPAPLQARVLDRWGDGSIRWLLCDLQIDPVNGPAAELVVGVPVRSRDSAARSSVDFAAPSPADAADFPQALKIQSRPDSVTCDTGTSTFEARMRAADVGVLTPYEGQPTAIRLRLEDDHGGVYTPAIDTIDVEERGPLRSVLRLSGAVGPDAKALHVVVRLHLFAGLNTLRCDVTLRNPHRAQHEGGHWDLGDAGSFFLRRWSLTAGDSNATPQGTVRVSLDGDDEMQTLQAPFELRQASSGGVHWDSRNHVTRAGNVSLPYQGYRITAGGESLSGLRASPILVVRSGTPEQLALFVDHFWQNFPIACAANGRGIEARLFDDTSPEPTELQGGEQKTHTIWLSAGAGTSSDAPLAWARKPIVLHLAPQAYCDAEAVPYMTPDASDVSTDHAALVRAAIEGPDTFDRKREIIDEYGWRHFGEIYGDHEAVRHAGPRPLVSHYNNQYDPVAGFAAQFMKTGELAWWRHMRELAAHVVDIDIYHTDEDKAAYNRGLFWHTIHYIDADTATHRTYPASCGHGGGPSSEHNYSTGLMLAWFLTGDARYREAALDLAHFPIRIDDGERTPFRWLARGDTGLASASASLTYQGPGRGSGNSLNALLDGYRLTGDRRFLDKAEQIIRRVVHPNDDVERHTLLDAERRWFYTMFLQALGKYLDEKTERGELDRMYGYAQASLLRYAGWMAEHEYPYLDTPEKLEFPTETWAAQDIRKCDVFNFARKHASTSGERERFAERARFFFSSSVSTLAASPTRTLARPVVVLLTSGQSHTWFEQHPDATAPRGPAADAPGEHVPFEPQRIRAVRRAKGLVGTAAVASVVGLGWALLTLLPRLGFF